MSLFTNAAKSASVIAVLFVVACTDDTPTDFGDPSPAPAIVDAVNGEDGNPFVFLKPPVVAQPPGDLFGDFNPDLRPVVEVCHLDEPTAGDCQILTTNDGSATPARFTFDGGPGGESVIVDPVAEEYQVDIHFGLFDLVGGETYRIVVRVGSRQLAFADITVLNPREMRNADTGSNIVFTSDRKTVPLKVRIDDGATCWEGPAGAEVVSCAAATTEAGEEETVSLTTSDGEEVDFHLPAGWTAEVGGQQQTELTISIEEVPAQFGTPEDPACFAAFQLGDPDTGEPANCYLVRADTDDDTDVTVEFGGNVPVLAFCPSVEVLQAIADGNDGWIMTSVEEDQAGTTLRTYPNVPPASDFGGCALPEQLAMGDSPFLRLASAAWGRVKPILSPLLPRPLHAADIGFGGSIDRLATIFFWSRTPVDLDVQPSPASVAVGSTLQLTPDPVFHEGVTEGGTFEVQWDTDDASVATVDADGQVTGVAAGTTQITATATNLLDPSFGPVSGSTTLTVTGSVPTLLTPTSGTIIQQNDPTIGCSLLLQNGRGFGYRIFFDWTDPGGADSYEVEAQRVGSAQPIVSTVVTQSELGHVSCNSFVPDGNLQSWEWRVRAITNGVPGPWTQPEPFAFGPCVLETGGPCVSATAPIGFEILPDGSSPVSGQSVTTEFQNLGVTFSYVRFDEGPGTPRICDSTPLSPAGVTSDHSVTFDDQTGSGANACTTATLGTITTTFGAATTAVEFTLSFPQAATPNLAAVSKSGLPLVFTTLSSTDYVAQNTFPMSEVRYRVSGDVDFIDVVQGTGGAVMLIDDVHLQQ